jgi:hypothetical protein
VEESSERTSIVNRVEENRANFCTGVDGKPLFRALNGMYTVTLKETKGIIMVSARAGQSGAVNKTSVKSIAQDNDFQQVKRRKRHISKDTLQTAKKSNKQVPTSAADKLPPKAVSSGNFFTPLRTSVVDTETIGVGNTLSEQKAPRKPGRPSPIMMTSTTNLIRLQSDLKDHVEGEYDFRKIRNESVS